LKTSIVDKHIQEHEHIAEKDNNDIEYVPIIFEVQALVRNQVESYFNNEHCQYSQLYNVELVCIALVSKEGILEREVEEYEESVEYDEDYHEDIVNLRF
jgi:hypothetical protein